MIILPTLLYWEDNMFYAHRKSAV